MVKMIDYGKIKFHDITQPKSGYKVYVNKYWLCDKNPSRALFYGSSAQCNNDEQIMLKAGLGRNILELNEKLNIDAKVIFVPVSYVGIKRD
jgi:hypothetical protein